MAYKHFEFTWGTRAVLDRAGIFSVEELCGKTVPEMLRLKGLGKLRLSEIRCALWLDGRSLKGDELPCRKSPGWPDVAWQYLIKQDLTGKQMDELGELGWELVTVIATPVGSLTYFFKDHEEG